MTNSRPDHCYITKEEDYEMKSIEYANSNLSLSHQKEIKFLTGKYPHISYGLMFWDLVKKRITKQEDIGLGYESDSPTNICSGFNSRIFDVIYMPELRSFLVKRKS